MIESDKDQACELPEWKLRQIAFHKINAGNFRDQCTESTPIVINNEISDTDLVDEVLIYFQENPEVLTYPAKSYFVAVVYAELLRQNFGCDFYEVLADKDLLFGNDAFFKTYCEKKNVYDDIIAKVGVIDLEKGQCPDVKTYFFEEFLLD